MLVVRRPLRAGLVLGWLLLVTLAGWLVALLPLLLLLLPLALLFSTTFAGALLFSTTFAGGLAVAEVPGMS